MSTRPNWVKYLEKVCFSFSLCPSYGHSRPAPHIFWATNQESSEFYVVKEGDWKVSELESVRIHFLPILDEIGNCQNWKVSESESVRIGKLKKNAFWHFPILTLSSLSLKRTSCYGLWSFKVLKGSYGQLLRMNQSKLCPNAIRNSLAPSILDRYMTLNYAWKIKDTSAFTLIFFSLFYVCLRGYSVKVYYAIGKLEFGPSETC